MQSRKYERPEVKQVTKQWVRENCKNITERDMGLLRLLYENKRRLLRRDQIEVLYPEFASTDRLNKRIKMLYHMHVIDRVYPTVGLGQGSAQQHICLDRAGAILLELDKYSKPIDTDANGNKTLVSGWEHKVMLNEYECRIRKMLKSLDGSVISYDVEEPHPYDNTRLIPDIITVFKCNGKGYLWFIEADLGTEDIPYIKSKLDAYRDYYLSKNWVNCHWAKHFKTPTFPRVLFLTENGRSKRIKTLQEYVGESSIRFFFGCHDDLENIMEGIIKG